MHLLIVGAGSELPPRARAARPGLRTSVICQQQAVPYLQEPERIDRLVVLPQSAAVSEWVAAARFINDVAPVTWLANYTEYDTDKTAAIAQALGVTAPSAETYRHISDKCAMRQRLAAAGVDDTPAAVAHTVEDIRLFGDQAGYPLICKPLSGVGSRGVVLVRSADEIDQAFRHTTSAAESLDVTQVMVERFHHGREFSVEAVSEDGRHLVACVTEKHLASGFVEIGHVLPAPLSPEVRSDIERTVGAALDALGVQTGVTHTEVIVTPEHVRIIETHLRLAGDEIPQMLARVSSIDLADALVRQSVGMSVLDELEVAKRRFDAAPLYAAIWYAEPTADGVIESIDGIDAARLIPDVRDVSVTVGRGDRISPLTMSRDRPAYAWATGTSAREALDRARAAVGELRFTTVADRQRGESAVVAGR
ncbi:ATP-grasp domain-containing protein [Micromonospora sp. NPDC049171]|uniref:ATP-grasp domain-containing protein n=1 Tax=Micromonospora sp. NPDC049171 TaxID=3155770 RepID=UPI0033E71BA7